MNSKTARNLLPIILAAALAGATDGKWDIFLLFGQSNMAGPPAPEAKDTVTNPRIRVLGYDNCSSLKPARTYDKWALAKPPLHECYNGVGPGDWFAKTLIDTSDKLGLGIDTIGLVPCAISGVDIDFFRKGIVSSRRSEFSIPPDNSWKGAYPWMVTRIDSALKKGTVRGILFHQGESNSGQSTWPAQVKQIVDSLKKDFGWGDLPFLAGELRYQDQGGCCSGHNTQVNKLPSLIPNCSVVSAKGLTGLSTDVYHFSLAGMREFGHRYAAAMVPYLKSTSVEEGGSDLRGLSIARQERAVVVRSEVALERVRLVSLQGKVFDLGSGREIRIEAGRFQPGVYVLQAVSGSSLETRKVLLD
jgi:hypothetical protein